MGNDSMSMGVGIGMIMDMSMGIGIYSIINIRIIARELSSLLVSLAYPIGVKEE